MRRIVEAMLTAWLLAMLAVYFIYNPPFDAAWLAGLSATLWAAGVGATITIICAGVGKRLFARWPDWHEAPLPERLAIECGTGLGVAGLCWLALGLAGWLTPVTAWVVTGVGVIVAARPASRWLAESIAAVRSASPATRFDQALSIFCALIILLALLNALAPPTAWDALLYHLTAPKWDIAAGRISIDPHLPEGGYPQGVELLFGWAMLLGSARAAAVVHWSFGWLTLLVVWSWGRELRDSPTAWLACAVLLSASTLPILMGQAYIDVATVFYAAAAFACMQRWRENRQGRWLLLASVMIGFAFGTKYTGGLIGVALLPVVARADYGRLWRNGLTLALPALALAAAWFLKNALMAGNPAYPFFFDGLGWDATRRFWYSRPGTGLLATDPIQLLIAPLTMSLFGSEGREIWHATLGPLFVGLLPLVAWCWREMPHRRWLGDALVFSLALYGLWLYGAATTRLMIQPRLLIPALPALAVACAVGARHWGRQTVVRAAVVIVLAVASFTALADAARNDIVGVLIGATTEEDYLHRRLGWHMAAMRNVDHLPDGSRVIFLFEPRSYYCQPHRCAPDGILDHWYSARRRGADWQGIAAEWRGQGFTHVLVYSLGAQVIAAGESDFITDADWQQLAELENSLRLLANFGDAYKLYALGEP